MYYIGYISRLARTHTPHYIANYLHVSMIALRAPLSSYLKILSAGDNFHANNRAGDVLENNMTTGRKQQEQGTIRGQSVLTKWYHRQPQAYDVKWLQTLIGTRRELKRQSDTIAPFFLYIIVMTRWHAYGTSLAQVASPVSHYPRAQGDDQCVLCVHGVPFRSSPKLSPD